MDCEDCENYKPKEEKELKEKRYKFKEIIYHACVDMKCSNCVFGPIYEDCKVRKCWILPEYND